MQYACNTGVGEYSTGVRWNDYNEISHHPPEKDGRPDRDHRT